MRILVVDDDASTRRLLEARLESWGHEPLVAADGGEAWEQIQSTEINLILLDWNMPGLSGIELCQRVRAASFAHYVYIILCTGRESKQDLITGLEAGADDFLTKPIDFSELKVVLRAGSRVLNLEARLNEQNKNLEDAYRQISEAYQTIKRDLETASTLQKSLLPASEVQWEKVNISSVFCPALFLAGDTLNFFDLDGKYTVFYHLDVSGHGASSALISVLLNHLLSPRSETGLIWNQTTGDLSPPELVIARLNDQFQNFSDLYFTMVYGIIDFARQSIEFSQAGHPNPIYLGAEADSGELVGQGGFPVGAISPMDYDRTILKFAPGDRFILYSDGIPECRNTKGEPFGVNRLITYFESQRTECIQDVSRGLTEQLRNWRMVEGFDDDISLLAFEAR